MTDQPTMPVKAQVAAIREMLLEDRSSGTLTEKLEVIKVQHPYLAEGVEAVLEDSARPNRAGSGSVLRPNPSLADLI